MNRSVLRLAGMVGLLGAAACGGEEDMPVERMEIQEPSAAEPTATSAAPAEMGVDTVGDGVHGDTMRR